ncbi:MAG: radical SAM family heme chaperone HemW [bacterium]
MVGLYIHIPFCKKRCNYCDFTSYSSFGEKEYLIDPYLKALEIEAGAVKCIRPDTIYIGGGTPSLLSNKQLQKLFSILNCKFDLSRIKEISFEANPESINKDKFSLLKDNNVNRVSLGFQSCKAKYLKILGRIHSNEDALNAFNTAKILGFDFVNIDLIFGLPFQTLREWISDLKNVLNLAPNHISIYELTMEPDSPMCELKQHVDQDLAADMYKEGIDLLLSNGYLHYEISNFSKPGCECKHNLNYWLNGEYAGLGVGASSYIKGRRFRNSNDIKAYISQAQEGKFQNEDVVTITQESKNKEKFFLGLRLTEGVRCSKKEKNMLKEKLSEFMPKGLVAFKNERVALTSKGIMLANQILRELL